MERWFAFFGPNDWIGEPPQPIFHLVGEEFASGYADRHPDTIVWVSEKP